jgi:hypothetical protein
VIASFGANVTGTAGTTANAGLAIAQFFATGIAARRLAEKGGERLVTVRTVSEEELKTAKEGAAKAEKRAEAAEGKIIQLGGRGTMKDVEEETLQRQKALQDLIETLSDAKVFALNRQPPGTTPKIEEAVEIVDPSGRRFDRDKQGKPGDVTIARRVLKMRVSLARATDLDAWEAAVKGE